MAYREEKQIWDVQNNGLKRMIEWISNTISREIKYKIWTQKDEDGKKYSRSPYAMLKGLQHFYGPTEKSRIYDLTKEYEALQRYLKGQDLCKWVDQWKDIEPKVQEVNYLEKVKDNQITWEKLTNIFYDYFQMMTSMHCTNRTAFEATLGGLPADPTNDPSVGPSTPIASYRTSGKKSERKGWNKPYLCGLMHRYTSCWYLIPSKRRQGWKEDPQICKKINEELKNPEIKERVEKILEKYKARSLQKGNNQQNYMAPSDNADHVQSPEHKYSSFYTIFSAAPTPTSYNDSRPQDHTHYHCILADFVATSHVLNAAHKDRLTNLLPANGEFLTYGDTRTMIEAFGDAYIKPDDGEYFVL
ncbi:hypothetical protein VTO42DRAFT_4410 [Malbranchea cinnamomea]